MGVSFNRLTLRTRYSFHQSETKERGGEGYRCSLDPNPHPLNLRDLCFNRSANLPPVIIMVGTRPHRLSRRPGQTIVTTGSKVLQLLSTSLTRPLPTFCWTAEGHKRDKYSARPKASFPLFAEPPDTGFT